MTEAQIVEKYTRVLKTSLGLWIQAMVIKNPQSNSPEITWKGVGRMLPVRALPENVEIARYAALKDRRFFKQCTHCGEVRPPSLILTGEVCADCMGMDVRLAA
ncbi:hypothetical protein SAMN02745166_03851 [Prosthecobacter debontii]|uniref:Uncharacterized protein n=1 Tax=Prosthecobacter debontii TaxID=48467 RepID=A0A1T4YPD8_9BACT|nr:hypothetical protein [Prosthecobacter debontii]SKB03590.1 hypothetical protein SAMN02745166_03851 [Prosthecobacter debontii]